MSNIKHLTYHVLLVMSAFISYLEVSQTAAAALLRGMAELGRISRSRSHRDLHRDSTSVSSSFQLAASSVPKGSFVVESEGIVDVETVPTFVEGEFWIEACVVWC